MSDDLGAFIRKTDAMIEALERHVEKVARNYVVQIAAHVIRFTPGVGLQYPHDTTYRPTGRLRGGWHISGAPIGSTSRYEGGPFSLMGDEALTGIEAEVWSRAVPEHVYIVNDVAYGYMIQEALGAHSTDRPNRDWVKRTKDRQHTFLREAKAAAGAP